MYFWFLTFSFFATYVCDIFLLFIYSCVPGSSDFTAEVIFKIYFWCLTHFLAFVVLMYILSVSCIIFLMYFFVFGVTVIVFICLGIHLRLAFIVWILFCSFNYSLHIGHFDVKSIFLNLLQGKVARIVFLDLWLWNSLCHFYEVRKIWSYISHDFLLFLRFLPHCFFLEPPFPLYSLSLHWISFWPVVFDIFIAYNFSAW